MVIPGTVPFYTYHQYLKKVFGSPAQKLSINTGLTCPNRDGTKGLNGCTYCNNKSFSPYYTDVKNSIANQLERGMKKFATKKNTPLFLAYFQSYSNTYSYVNSLREMYYEALNYPGIKGIVISTRPDCLNNEILDLLSEIAGKYYISVELGVESTEDKTLKKINRCHTYNDSIVAIKQVASRGIPVGAHLIIGLPGENPETFVNHAKRLSQLPISMIKMHHLQILKHTQMANDYLQKSSEYSLLYPNEYKEIVINMLEQIPENIVVQRFLNESPAHLLIAPKWNGLKNYQFVNTLVNTMNQQNTWQGKKITEAHKD
ncbi:MAG: TIGR01212 family radical SAM protein [Bacteroidetes bacterium]|nr:TIGR01212 family radical SAM protein [Bacteroidota bacterium]MBV6460384.1 hypothetical protein [Flavobacteriales bacterium]WKZ74752.1 MAG: TIGR01212 family radical SAM protein [Vicingaceae bacterium]MCL4815748.1 TIGR01212 family radical SAM protein [Flavobacteriales bacterium]NOG95804.1 TIGR01212 family radical SAM protein [Bacteroidota bacterium]